ncbi:hypothetical protein I4641_23710, partial [Waterburya agarophytonicola K14]
MANLTLDQIFGINTYLEIPEGAPAGIPNEVRFWLGNFANTSGGGQIENNLGLDIPANINSTNQDEYAAKILYGILLLIRQNQAENINADPTQSIFIS